MGIKISLIHRYYCTLIIALYNNNLQCAFKICRGLFNLLQILGIVFFFYKNLKSEVDGLNKLLNEITRTDFIFLIPRSMCTFTVIRHLT